VRRSLLEFPELFEAGSGLIIEFNAHRRGAHIDLRGYRSCNKLQPV
jgi:hypothetical protein